MADNIIKNTKGNTVTTPKASAYWAKVTKAGQYGKFEIDLHMEPEQANDFLAVLQPILDEAEKDVAGANKEYNLQGLDKGQDDKGRTIFKIKLDEFKKDGAPNTIKFFDKFGKQDTNWTSLIGNESVVKVQTWVKPYYIPASKNLGLSMRINAVQVIDLVEFGGSGGFGDESDGDAPFDTADTANEDF